MKTAAAALTLTVLPMAALAADDGDAPIRVLNMQERQHMADYLANHISPRDVVTSFTTTIGDEVDCVDLYAQPALKQPGMEQHVIEFAPKTFPKTKSRRFPASQGEHEQKVEASSEAAVTPPQTIGSPNEQCPEGSVPLRRVTMETLQRFKTLDDFRKKVPSHIGTVRDFDLDRKGDEQLSTDDIVPPRIGASSLHQYAHAYRSVANWGAESVFNLWNPYTERSSEFSLSQMWVVRGSGSSRETVEAGWQKYKDLYGDWNARLFIYFTPDNYGSGGCYNLTCGAFVQTNNTVYIGGAFTEYSQLGGAQKTITLLWYKDGTNGHWWLRYGDTWVGYYPRSRFDANGLRDQAAKVDFGGEIIDKRTDGRHTRTDMGSGRWPYEGFGYAAYQRSLKYVDTSNFYREASSLTATRTDRECYDISLHSSSGSWGRYFYFGGSGYNTNCQ
jgi:hypothetical protein